MTLSLVRILLVLVTAITAGAVPQERPNVLLICVDDLRPDLGAYGDPHARTPNLDRLAARSRTFLRHYVQAPTCGASRFALMSGRLPLDDVSLGNGAFGQLAGSDGPPTMPLLFRRAGYETICLGKIGHEPGGLKRDGSPEMPDAWTRIELPEWRWGDGWGGFFGYADGSSRERGESPPLEVGEVDQEGYADGLIAGRAVELLEELAGSDGQDPFFLAVGFYKPHLPFAAPRTYWEMFDPADLPLAPFSGKPEGVDVGLALHGSGELLRNYGAHPRPGEVDEAYARELRHGYRASTSYVDAQVGRVLSALDRTGLAKNTVVVVWGDHGWHLGDHGVWGKHTLFERSLHSPLILRTPEMPSPGVPTRTVVESVDVLPTLLALAGISRPDGLDGRELNPALESPTWSRPDHARSYWRRGPHRGVSVRTDRYRATAWYRDGLPVAHEIYDHELDPNETRNAWDAVPESDLVDLLSRVASSRRFGD